MTHNDKRTETLVGAFLLIGCLLLGLLIMQFSKFGELIRGSYEITVEFQKATGVIKGSAVRLSGTKIGKVSEVPKLAPDATVLVTLSIDEDIKLQKDSVFQIASSGILGDSEIVITPPQMPTDESIAAGANLLGGGLSGIELIQSEAETIAADVRILMKDAQTALIKMDSSLDDIRTVALRLSESIEIVNNDLLSEDNVASFSSSLKNIEKATANISTLGDDIQPVLVEAKDAIRQINETAQTVEGTFAQAQQEITKLEPALAEVPKTMRSISGTADEAKNTLRAIRSGDGALGALAYDKEVKDDTQNFIKNLRKYGILGYRDEKQAKEDDPRNRFRGRRR